MKYRVLCDTKAYLVMSGKGPYLYECLREGDIIDGDAKDGSVCYPNAKGYVYMVSLTDVSPLFPESRGTTANEFNRMQAMADLAEEANMPTTPEPEKLDRIDAILAERGAAYGGMENSFGRIAKLWNGYLDAIQHHTLLPEDVARMMQLLKMARRMALDKPTQDSFDDGHGYLKCEAKLSWLE